MTEPSPIGNVWIMRHGEAAPGYPDHARRLTARGERDVARMAEWMAAQPSAGERLRLGASPFTRAQQTAAIIAEHLGLEVETLDKITPDDSVEPVIDWLQDKAQATSWLLVSHMPLVGDLTARLVEGDRRASLGFAPAAIASLKAEVWAAGCARLKGFTTPGDVG